MGQVAAASSCRSGDSAVDLVDDAANGNAVVPEREVDGTAAAMMDRIRWDALPPEIFERFLHQRESMPDARLVCRSWASAAGASCREMTLKNEREVPAGWAASFRGLERIVWHSYMAKPLPPCIATLGRLTSLCVFDASQGDLVHLQHLPCLASLDIRHSDDLRDSDLNDLLPLHGTLTSLDLNYCSGVTSSGLAALSSLSRLVTLKLRHSEVLDDQAIESLRRLEAIETLNLSSCCPITEIGLQALTSFSNLTFLDLSFSEAMTSMEFLRPLGALTSLNLASCGEGVTDRGLSILKNMTGLSFLDVTGCDCITSQGLSELSALTSLETLHIGCCMAVGDSGLRALHPLTRLTDLDLEHLPLITDEGLAALRHMPRLAALNLSKCLEVTDDGLASLARHPELRCLDLSFCPRLTDAGLEHLRGLTALQELVLALCRHLTHRGLEALQPLQLLETLDLEGCWGLDDRGLEVIRASFPSLTNLNLAGCNVLTTLEPLSHMTSLRYLHLPGQNGSSEASPITPEQVEDLQLQLPGCQLTACLVYF